MGAVYAVDNPATGETYTFLERAADTRGEVLRLRWSAQPGGAVGEHIHPLQEESFSVLEGELTVSVDGRETTRGMGETAVVPAGRRHFFANRGCEVVRATLELRPALRMEQVFESLAGMAREGRTRPSGLPRNPLLLAVFAAHFSDEIRGPRPAFAVQRAVLPPLARIGRLLGHRAHRPEYRAEVAGREVT
jgi:quercetin dioxygenase-like cupin family protein